MKGRYLLIFFLLGNQAHAQVTASTESFVVLNIKNATSHRGMDSITPPQYPGGKEAFTTAFRKYFRNSNIAVDNISNLDDSFAAQIQITLFINDSGHVKSVKVRRDPGYGFGKETIRTMQQLNKNKTWTPAIKKGRSVQGHYTVLITYNKEILEPVFQFISFTEYRKHNPMPANLLPCGNGGE